MTLTSTILMVRPAAFGFNYDTAVDNFFQSNPGSTNPQLTHQLALAEFDNMVNVLRANEIDVLVIDDTLSPEKPSAIFPNNWLSTSDDGSLIIYPMCATSRRTERRIDIINQLKKNYLVTNLQDWSVFEVDDLFLEGTGSMVIDYENKIIFASLSPRTSSSLIEKFAQKNSYRYFTFSAADKLGNIIYHTNVMMCLGASVAIICIDAIGNETERREITKLLKSTGREIIFLSLEQMHCFAGNMLQLKNKKGSLLLLMSKRAFDCLTTNQKSRLKKYTQLLPIPINTIENCEGGSVRCMMAEIFLEKK